LTGSRGVPEAGLTGSKVLTGSKGLSSDFVNWLVVFVEGGEAIVVFF
jgi:hypothetical protein